MNGGSVNDKVARRNNGGQPEINNGAHRNNGAWDQPE
jgi:hypothetical protein